MPLLSAMCNYAKIDPLSIANGPGVRIAVFVSGCRMGCPGCFNQEGQDFAYGTPLDYDTIGHVLDLMSAPHVRGLTILGGEPMEPENQPSVLRLVRAVRERYQDSRDIWLFTGFVFERLVSGRTRSDATMALTILEGVDVLVDGPFETKRKNITLRFRGSSNQRIIDVRKTLDAREVVIWDDGQRRGRM